MMDCFIIFVGFVGDGPCWASLGLSEPLVRGWVLWVLCGGDLFFLIFSFIIVVLFGNSCYLCKKQCIKLSSVRVYRETHEEGDGSLLFLYTRFF